MCQKKYFAMSGASKFCLRQQFFSKIQHVNNNNNNNKQICRYFHIDMVLRPNKCWQFFLRQHIRKKF